MSPAKTNTKSHSIGGGGRGGPDDSLGWITRSAESLHNSSMGIQGMETERETVACGIRIRQSFVPNRARPEIDKREFEILYGFVAKYHP